MVLGNPLENAANNYHYNGKRVAANELPKLFKECMYPFIVSGAGKMVRGNHRLIRFPGITYQAPSFGWRKHYPLELIYNTQKIGSEVAADYLVEGMNIPRARSVRWKRSNDHTSYGVYDGNAILSLGDPNKISGIQRYLHTALLSESLSFVNPPLCASTVIYVSTNIYGPQPLRRDQTMDDLHSQMEAVKASWLHTGDWISTVRIDGLEPSNYIQQNGRYICIDPVINES